MNSWRFFEGSSTSAIVRRQRPAQARWCFTNNNLNRLHLFCLLVNDVDPRSYNYVQGDDMRDSNPTFSCCLARVAILVRYNNWGRRRRVDENDRSFLSFFVHFQSKNSAETWNNRSPRSKEHFGAKKLEIDLRQKSRFWSVHACLNFQYWVCVYGLCPLRLCVLSIQWSFFSLLKKKKKSKMFADPRLWNFYVYENFCEYSCQSPHISRQGNYKSSV